MASRGKGRRGGGQSNNPQPPAKQKELVQHPETDTDSLGPCWGKEEQTASLHVPLMTKTMVSRNSEIPASEGNLISCVQAGDKGNTSSASTD